ncbi:MAG: hypothetical protein PHX07_08040, partial [Candidatus Marinimicrobia bacterium]|nr:hypothetical protein [Candidatus Neomarinimicrobiota bacterium]
QGVPTMKFLNILRMVTFIATLLTTIPLFINYIRDVAPKLDFLYFCGHADKPYINMRNKKE